MTTAADHKTGTGQPRPRTAPRRDDIFYPYSDGEPMGESQPHVEAIRALLDALDDLFWDEENVSVHGNMHWYWQQGDASRTRAPDAMIIPGVPMDHQRTSFKSWEHGGRVPSTIIETASYKTYRANLGEVREDYETNGVREYFIFDASRLYLPAPLLGFRLARRKYRDIPAESDGSMVSRELDVRLKPEGQLLRLIDLRTGEPIPTRPERLAFYRARLDERDAQLAKQQAQLAEQAAELKRAHALLRKHGLDPDAGK
ncbi:MAG TPA: Uma2 family endonuclease [Gemmataceae bacterium]|nr:Uma2 family endonuclease [Gemmataceae bacterium]